MRALHGGRFVVIVFQALQLAVDVDFGDSVDGEAADEGRRRPGLGGAPLRGGGAAGEERGRLGNG